MLDVCVKCGSTDIAIFQVDRGFLSGEIRWDVYDQSSNGMNSTFFASWKMKILIGINYIISHKYQYE